MHGPRSTFMLAAALCALLPPATAAAGGVYLGGGIGVAKTTDRVDALSALDFDESDTAYKLFGGYRFDVLPIVSLSAEVGYRDLGRPDADIREYRVDGFDYSALAGVGLGPVELFARVGGMRYDLTKSAGDLRTEFDGTAPIYGVGARFGLFGLGVRAEYEKMDIDELDDAEMFSVSAFFEF